MSAVRADPRYISHNRGPMGTTQRELKSVACLPVPRVQKGQRYTTVTRHAIPFFGFCGAEAIKTSLNSRDYDPRVSKSIIPTLLADRWISGRSETRVTHCSFCSARAGTLSSPYAVRPKSSKGTGRHPTLQPHFRTVNGGMHRKASP